jgi:hypothetical protein
MYNCKVYGKTCLNFYKTLAYTAMATFMITALSQIEATTPRIKTSSIASQLKGLMCSNQNKDTQLNSSEQKGLICDT